ncbi:hypothetical protein I3760_13G156500 [Carya illinoinensis]|nr:hypothetical protein I3760_13G156500 [Carya illinoinensis]
MKLEPMSFYSHDPPSSNTNKYPTSTPNGATNTNENDNDTTTTNTTNNNNDEDKDDEEDDEEDPPPKKQKPLSSLTTPPLVPVKAAPMEAFLDKSDDTQDMKICLSKIYKAEKVELSDDRLSVGSTKGYKMVRATRGVVEGAWYFEIKVASLGESSHTRLGWSTEKGDLQAPVGYDENSFGYRDIDGSKVHKVLREKYGEEGYKEGDVIGFYISLPEGGSEISFFKNGIWQGVAFKDLCGGRYYPAASMYTLPNQPNCVVKFNFGPDFEFFPMDFNERPVPRPMVEVPYHGFENRVENGVSTEKNH